VEAFLWSQGGWAARLSDSWQGWLIYITSGACGGWEVYKTYPPADDTHYPGYHWRDCYFPFSLYVLSQFGSPERSWRGACFHCEIEGEGWERVGVVFPWLARMVGHKLSAEIVIPGKVIGVAAAIVTGSQNKKKEGWGKRRPLLLTKGEQPALQANREPPPVWAVASRKADR
jgi:hypothetical protein